MNTSRLFFLIGSIFFPLVFGIIIPIILKQEFKVTAFWIGFGFIIAAALPLKMREALFYPINKVAMVLGFINQTVILGLLFFAMFTPIALFRKLWGIDTLILSSKGKTSFWREPDEKWINFDRPY